MIKLKSINCFFVTDIHGDKEQYQKLFDLIIAEKPKAVFMGGDLLPSMLLSFKQSTEENFISDYLTVKFRELKKQLNNEYPEIFIILGNDDPLSEEIHLLDSEEESLWKYVHNRKVPFGEYTVFGYAFIPPSPFLLKDWEKYDVSRYVDPGCVSPEEGYRSIKVDVNDIKYSTIKKDLDSFTKEDDLSKAIFLFHSPPYKCNLDRANLDGKFIDHVPLDVHVGSVAIKEFLEERKPLLSLHGHIHESYSITGEWKDTIGETLAFSAAHDGKELALVRFDLNNLTETTREHI